MFIDTTDTIIKAVMNTEHFTRILRITLHSYVCSYTFSSSGSQPCRHSNPAPLSQIHYPAMIDTCDPPPFCLYHSLTALCIHCLTCRHKTLVNEHLAAALPLSLTCEHKIESSHAVCCLLYKSYCMPENFYATMDKPSRTFTLSQLLIWKRLV